MKEKNVTYMKIDASENSALVKGIRAYLHDLSLLRKKRAEDYKKKVEKQIKKIERSGL